MGACAHGIEGTHTHVIEGTHTHVCTWHRGYTHTHVHTHVHMASRVHADMDASLLYVLSVQVDKWTLYTCCDTWTLYTYSRDMDALHMLWHMDALHIQQRHGRSTHTAPYSTVCMYIRIYIQCIHAYIHTVAICIHTICYTTTCIVLRRMHTRHWAAVAVIIHEVPSVKRDLI
jgi:hypothetical protein